MTADRGVGGATSVFLRFFLSYRRQDTAFQADSLYGTLAAAFGAEHVFKDVDSIDPGDDFALAIERAVTSCHVLLALIGDRWLSVADEDGNRRLDDPNDFVRLEIESAFRAGIRVVPVLVGAELPTPAQLPRSLAPLAGRQAVFLSPHGFADEAKRLVERLARLVEAEDASLGRSRTNLRRALTSFIDRETEVIELSLLLTENRLVTLTGVGGGGKTRLAVRVGFELLGDFPEGVWFVELANLRDAGHVLQAVAASIGVREHPTEPLFGKIIEHLREKKALLLFDNCEHLMDAVPEDVEAILSECPKIHVLATSREPLGVPGEIVWRIAPLSYPPVEGLESAQAMRNYPAVQLFVERARSNNPNLHVADQDISAIAAICSRLDGIPLAIELAGSLAHIAAYEAILTGLDDRFALLTRGPRTSPQRQRTLAAAIDWSYAQLGGAERRLFRRLSIFLGQFDLRDMEVVGYFDSPERDAEILVEISALVDKSLVVARDGRFYLLETIREYAHQRLQEAGEMAAVSRRHARHIRRRMSNRVPGQMAAWLTWMDDATPDVRAAFTWLFDDDPSMALDMAAAALPYWQLRGRMFEARQVLDRLIPRIGEDAAERARALTLVGEVSYIQFNIGAGVAAAEEALTLVRDVPDLAVRAGALRTRGRLAAAMEELSVAEACCREALSIWRSNSDLEGQARACHDLGVVAGLQGNFEESKSLFERSLSIRTETRTREEGHVTLTLLAMVKLLTNDVGGARSPLRESLESAVRLGDRRAAWALDVRACIAFIDGDARRAVVTAAAAAAMHEASGAAPLPAWTEITSAWINPATEALSSHDLELARTEGASMNFEEALSYALVA